MHLYSKLTALLAAALLWAPLASVHLHASAALAGEAAAVRGQIPGGLYTGFAPAWVGAVQGFLSQEGAIAGLGESMLPSLTRLDLSLPESHGALAPIAHHLSASLGYEPNSFATLSLEEKREVMALAAEEAASDIEAAAFELAGRQGVALGNPKQLPEYVKQLEAFRTHYSLYLAAPTRAFVEEAYTNSRGRLAEIRESGLLASADATAAALSDTKASLDLVVTRNFHNESGSWGRGDWDRLERELDKVRALIESGEPLRGEKGNIKFLSGPLSGMGEIKFGHRRTHRIFFRYLRESGRIALIRYLPREHMNSSRAVPEMALFLDDALLEKALIETTPETVPFMHRLDESEISALQPL